MKLYFYPGACSLAVHIAAAESGQTLDLEKVDLAQKRTATGADFNSINPKGYVPALQLDNGEILTEAGVCMQYLADRVPGKLLPQIGTMERYRVLEWMNFITSEIHKQLAPLFNPSLPADARERQMALLTKRLGYLADTLQSQDYLNGPDYSIADAYLFTVLNWTGFLKVDLSPWPALQRYQTRVANRPAVQAAMKAEGLTG